jgi:6-phosphofructokinase 1
VSDAPRNVAVLTSGGDSPGMNAAVRAVIRTALHDGLEVHTIDEGYRGMVDGGDAIRRASAEDAGGILHRGGTVLGSARCKEFRTRDGRRRAAANLVERGIDALVVIGGDGSLTGANLFRTEWPELLDELVEAGDLARETADAHRDLLLVGLVGSIDNDMFGTDMTIGADTALHRIIEALDAIHSTASSHQRTFVVEVMGRHCGYLALMSALASGANWVFIPESPPDVDDWREAMCRAIEAGRDEGRRQSLVVVAEGATDRNGDHIATEEIRSVLEERLGEDTRVTILGHVQRGGSPSAFDRTMATMLGFAAVRTLLTMGPEDESKLIGIRDHDVVVSPLVECVDQTHAVAERIAAGDHETAMEMRGGSFRESFRVLRTVVRARPHSDGPGTGRTIGVMHAGGSAPGMNTAVRAAVRLALDDGHQVLGIERGYEGLRDDQMAPLDWMSVSGWVAEGGAELGTSRWNPTDTSLRHIAEVISRRGIDGLLVIGGFDGHQGAYTLHSARRRHTELRLPIACLPTSINNDLPGSELSIGADTALNAIVGDVDRIKQSAVASRRVFVVEVMGHDCGYLGLVGGIATGAERVYLPEEGIWLSDLERDVKRMNESFEQGKRLGLVIRSENADDVYTTDFLRRLFEKEGRHIYDVRQSILGHVQRGGDPSPFDRIQATRLASHCIDYLGEQMGRRAPESAFVGLVNGHVHFTALDRFPDLVEPDAQRPIEQWWLRLRPLAQVMEGRDPVGLGSDPTEDTVLPTA